MKITKIAESCSCGEGGGSYCDGNFGGPTGHLDSQVFPCKKDPSVETRKKRKKKKSAFNLKEYKTAELNEMITGPDMSSLTPTNAEEARRWLQEKYPNVAWTVEKVNEWMNENLSNKLKPLTGPKDLARRPLE